ncbi:MAG: flippase-like domain-containing protein [Anaerolineae bacterium]|jgi:uncharacterized protein (TIRG00374 family)|nr:flippase-like domain-containing protein [Anaerolineae bacterium]
MRKYRNQIILGIVAVIAIYVVLLLLLDNQGQFTEEVLMALSQFPLWLLLPLVGIQLIVAACRFWVWQYYLGVIGARDKISLLDSAVIFVSCFVMVVSPGKAAELLKAVFLKLKTGVPFTRSAPIVIAERVVDGIAVIVILCVTLLFLTDDLNLGAYLSISQLIVFSTGALLAFGLIAVQIEPLARLILSWIARLPLLRRLHPALRDLYESSREIFQLKYVLNAISRGIGVYIFSSIGFVIILYGFGVALTPTIALQATFINGVNAAIGGLSLVPNGAGVTELSGAIMLETIMAPANSVLTPGVIAAVALMQGFFHKWFRVLLGLIVMVIFRDRLFPKGEMARLEAEIEAYEQQKHPVKGVN